MDAEDHGGPRCGALTLLWLLCLGAVCVKQGRTCGPGRHLAGQPESRVQRVSLQERAVRPDRVAAQPGAAHCRDVRPDDHLGTDLGRAGAMERWLVLRPRKRRHLNVRHARDQRPHFGAHLSGFPPVRPHRDLDADRVAQPARLVRNRVRRLNGRRAGSGRPRAIDHQPGALDRGAAQIAHLAHSSKRRARCITVRLSHITRSFTRHSCVYTNCRCVACSIRSRMKARASGTGQPTMPPICEDRSATSARSPDG